MDLELQKRAINREFKRIDQLEFGANLSLGAAKDRPDVLRKLADYLENHYANGTTS